MDCAAGQECVDEVCVGPAIDACTNSWDLPLIQDESADVIGKATDCAFGCLGKPDDACAIDCVMAETGLSAACASCYAGMIDCSFDKCLADCVGDPSSDMCLECQLEFCIPAFDLCSGLGEDP